MAAEKVDFAVGSEFANFNEFKQRLKEYEDQEMANFYVGGSTTLQTRPNISAEVRQSHYYLEARYKCKFAGQPRQTVDENERKRQGSSYKQGCESCFKVVFRQTVRGPILVIESLNEDHSSHLRSESLYKAMPNQRNATVESAAEYLQKAAGAKANVPLLQAQISSQRGYATRQDIRNRINKVEKTSAQLNLSELEKMVNEMKNVQGSTVKVIYNQNNEVEGIFFQDARMKSYFNHFPDLLMFDGTYTLNDRRMPLVILLVIDGNAESQIAGFFVVRSENSDVYNALFEEFKKENAKHIETKIVLTDKAAVNRNVVENQLPNAVHHFCVFHVDQIYEREITPAKRNITKEEKTACLAILKNMIYAKDQDEFDDLYADLNRTGCQGVIDYFNNEWLNCVEQWVYFHVSRHQIFGQRTNNRLESLNGKLKAVITKYSSLKVFMSYLKSFITSLSIEKDIHAAEKLMKRPVNADAYYDNIEQQYSNLLTGFAFEKWMKEKRLSNHVQFEHIDEHMGICGTNNNRLLVRAVNCDCEFFMTMGLPCKHIYAFRNHNKLELFDPSICANRWLKQNMITVSQLDYVLDEEPNVELVGMRTRTRNSQTATQSQTQTTKRTTVQKYQLIKRKCDEICMLMSELPEREFEQHALKITDILNTVRQAANRPTQVNQNAPTTRRRNQSAQGQQPVQSTGQQNRSRNARSNTRNINNTTTTTEQNTLSQPNVANQNAPTTRRRNQSAQSQQTVQSTGQQNRSRNAQSITRNINNTTTTTTGQNTPSQPNVVYQNAPTTRRRNQSALGQETVQPTVQQNSSRNAQSNTRNINNTTTTTTGQNTLSQPNVVNQNSPAPRRQNRSATQQPNRPQNAQPNSRNTTTTRQTHAQTTQGVQVSTDNNNNSGNNLRRTRAQSTLQPLLSNLQLPAQKKRRLH